MIDVYTHARAGDPNADPGARTRQQWRRPLRAARKPGIKGELHSSVPPPAWRRVWAGTWARRTTSLRVVWARNTSPNRKSPGGGDVAPQEVGAGGNRGSKG